MSLDDLRNIATIVGVVIAVFTFIKGIIEYNKQGSQKRAEFFNAMRKKLKENSVFSRIRELLDDNDKALCDISFADRRDFLGFFEEIALMVNSKLLKKNVAHYMFGYYVIQCWKCEHFWVDIKKDSIYWRLFKEFAMVMEREEKKLKKTIEIKKIAYELMYDRKKMNGYKF
jgi:hypothetical protein